jgi:hypothetical protein
MLAQQHQQPVLQQAAHIGKIYVSFPSPRASLFINIDEKKIQEGAGVQSCLLVHLNDVISIST